MKITAFGRTLSLLEGPVDNVTTRAKAYNSPAGLDLTQDPTRTFRAMRNYRNIYLQGGYVATGIDLYPLYTIGEGYTLESDDEGKKEEIQKFLDQINFFDITWQMMVDACTVRDGIAEIVYGRGLLGDVPVNVVPRPAECFEFDTDLKGAITSYTQRYDNRGNTIQPIRLEPSQVFHYQFMGRSDSPYGIGLLDRAVHDIKRDTKVTEATTSGICLHGTPKWHIQVNSRTPDAGQVSDSDMSALEKQFENFNAKDQFITEGDILVEPKDTAGVPNVQQYSDVTLARVVAALGCPGELLGLRQGTTDATARSRVESFEKQIKSCQRDIEQLWNVQIIDKVTGTPGLVKLKLNPASSSEFIKKAGAITMLRTGSDPDAIAPADWCRDWLNIPEDERTPEEKPQKQEFPAGFGGFQPTQQEEWDSIRGRVKHVPGGKMSDPEDAALNELAAAAHALSEAVREGS
jgi:hypothetical protein